jgi:hypothetical protein
MKDTSKSEILSSAFQLSCITPCTFVVQKIISKNPNAIKRIEAPCSPPLADSKCKEVIPFYCSSLAIPVRLWRTTGSALAGAFSILVIPQAAESWFAAGNQILVTAVCSTNQRTFHDW